MILLFVVGAISPARAVEFTIENAGGSSVVLLPGQTVEIEIGVHNLSRTELLHLSGWISGVDPSIAAFQSGRVARSFFSIVCVAPSQCFGGIDQGWDGTSNTPEVSVTFQAIGLGTTVLQIGTDDLSYSGVVLPGEIVQQADQSTTFTIHVVPEPGTTLLLGLGLVSLARRRHSGAP